jgi:zinc transporter, ZIP family
MPQELQLILPYILSASGLGILGGLVAVVWAPRLKARSAIQHFAAGLVIAAVASELLPEVEKTGTPRGILLGFTAGGLTMIVLKWLVLKFEKREKGRHRLPIGLTVAAAVDTFMDGAIISAGFSSGRQLGGLLTIVLAIELFFLTLSVGTEFHKDKAKRGTGIVATTGVAFLLAIGAVIAFFLLRGVSPATVAILLAFGAAALIYLIAEELLVESIQAEESLFSTAMLFAGFLMLLAMKLLNPSMHPVH